MNANTSNPMHQNWNLNPNYVIKLKEDFRAGVRYYNSIIRIDVIMKSMTIKALLKQVFFIKNPKVLWIEPFNL